MLSRRSTLQLLIIALVALAGAATEAHAQQPTLQKLASESTIEQIKSRGTMRIGLSVFVPWAMPNKDGKLIGFEVDVAQKLAQDTGVELELVPTAWDGMLPALLGGKFDFIIGGLTITPKRALTINFSNPYDHSDLLAVVNKKLAPNITSLDQLNTPEITFASRRGALSPAIIPQMFPKAKQIQFDDENTQNQELINGNVTASLLSTPTPALLIERYPDTVRIIEKSVQTSYDGIGVRKGDPDTLAYLNSWITVRQADGWLEQRHSFWFEHRTWADQINPAK